MYSGITLASGTQADKTLRVARLLSVWEDAKVLGQEAVQESIKLAENPQMVPRISEVEYGIALKQFEHTHPEMILHYGCRPHRKFIEKLRRDHIVDRITRFYDLGEILLESDQVHTVPGFTADVQKAIKAAVQDLVVTVVDVEDGKRRIQAFYIACEMQGICPFTTAAGPLKYIKKLCGYFFTFHTSNIVINSLFNS